jgi:ribose transport system substrate-binding protein
VPKTVLVVVTGASDNPETNAFQQLQQESAIAEGRRARGLEVEVVFAPAFDHLLVIRKRMHAVGAAPVDAVVVEPGSVAFTRLLLKDLQGRSGLVLLNTWVPEIEEYAQAWGTGLPFGTISTHHTRVGEIQGKQVAALLPQGGHVLCITGPPQSSAAAERLEGLTSVLRPAPRSQGDRAKGGTPEFTSGVPEVSLAEIGAGGWTEADGRSAFGSWYGVYKTRDFRVDVVAAQNDDLAVGARSASEALTNAAHRETLGRARFLGVDACPGYGQKLVDEKRLFASVTTPANTGEAVRSLQKFWESGRPLALKAFTEPTPYPLASAR